MTRPTGLQRRALIGAAAMALAGCFRRPELEPFALDDTELMVLLPKGPAVSARALDTPDGSMTVHSATVTIDGVVYTVMHGRLPEAQAQLFDRRIDALWAFARESVVKEFPGALRETRGAAAKKPVIHGMEYVVDAANGRQVVRARVFWHRGVLMQLIAVVPTKASYNQELYSGRFLESLTARP